MTGLRVTCPYHDRVSGAAIVTMASLPVDTSTVDILGVRFPRLTQEAAVALLGEWVAERRTVAVAFPDMSTLNTAWEQPQFRELLGERFVTFNDGAGLAFAATLRRRPFPANLNGTDLCPALLAGLAPGTSVFLLGAAPGVAERARTNLSSRFPHVDFVGSHHGYLDDEAEAEVARTLGELHPAVVMVGMGNPLQVEFISRHLDDPALAGTMWLAVGGQLDYYGGGLSRAPAWMVKARLEWLHLVLEQPHKRRRYFVGIPLFLSRVLRAQAFGGHDIATDIEVPDIARGGK